MNIPGTHAQFCISAFQFTRTYVDHLMYSRKIASDFVFFFFFFFTIVNIDISQTDTLLGCDH